jgi:hypothetical protein
LKEEKGTIEKIEFWRSFVGKIIQKRIIAAKVEKVTFSTFAAITPKKNKRDP